MLVLSVHDTYFFILYRFERDCSTGWAKISNRETTLEMCTNVYEGPGFIPIRDKYVKIARQTHDSKLDFMYCDDAYVMKIFHKGKPKEVKNLDSTQFFQLAKEYCNIDFEVTEIPKK